MRRRISGAAELKEGLSVVPERSAGRSTNRSIWVAPNVAAALVHAADDADADDALATARPRGGARGGAHARRD